MQNNDVNERKTFNAKVKDILTAVKPEKDAARKRMLTVNSFLKGTIFHLLIVLL